MVFLFLAAAVVPYHPGQTLAGPAFERFAVETDRICPARKLREITPGDLSWEQEGFEARLSARERRRLATVDNQARCEGHDGLACPTTTTLGAMARVEMMRAFSGYACSHRAPEGVVVSHEGSKARR